MGKRMKRGKAPTMAELRRLAQHLGFDAEVFTDVYGSLHACWARADTHQSIRIEADTKTAKRIMAAALRELARGKGRGE